MFKELDGGIQGAIDRALKYGNLRYKLFCALFDKMGYSNHELQSLEVRNKVYRYVERKYKKYLNYDYEKKDCGKKSEDVWICWLQGINQAPEIVQTCFASVKKWMPDKKIHVIDKSNIFSYVQLPKYVIEKWEKGLISNTLLSDFIRLSILVEYGGIWIDATVLLTGPIPEYIDQSDFFIYQSNIYDLTKVGESWFIKANADNRILKTTLNLLIEYWKCETKIRDYFLMFLFMKMACDKYSEDICDMYRIPMEIPILLQKNMMKKYDKNLYKEICRLSSIHKLTYKINVNNKDNTFYDAIINEYR